MKLSKATKNAIALLGVIAIAAVFVILSLHKSESSTSPPLSAISDNDRHLDELKHPELSDNENWIEANNLDKDAYIDSCDDFIKPKYSNNEVLSCELFMGGSLNIGVNSTDISDYLIINPYYVNSNDSEDASFGIYVSASQGMVFYPDTEIWPTQALSDNCRVITDRTYDTAISSSALSCWKHTDELISIPEAVIPAEVHFRVIRFSDYTVVGTAVAEIVWENDHYALSNLRNSDVSSDGYLSQNMRKDLINSAIDFIFNPETGPSFNIYYSDYREVMLQMATVEHCIRPYFNNLLDCNGNLISAGSISNCDLISVNVPYIGTGNITVYLAPELQAKGFNAKSVFFDDTSAYLPIAYDFLYPFSKDSLLVP